METYVLCILKSTGEKYLFFFDLESRGALLDQLSKFAADPELSFTWHDAKVLSDKLKKVVK